MDICINGIDRLTVPLTVYQVSRCLPSLPIERCSGWRGWPLRREEAFPVYWLLRISIQKTDPFCERTDVSRSQSRGNECFHQLVSGEQTAKWRACSPSLLQPHRHPPACAFRSLAWLEYC